MEARLADTHATLVASAVPSTGLSGVAVLPTVWAVEALGALAPPSPPRAHAIPAAGCIRVALHSTVRPVPRLCAAGAAWAAVVARAAAAASDFVTGPATVAVDSRIAQHCAIRPIPMRSARVAPVAVVPRVAHTVSIGGARAMAAAAHLGCAVHGTLPPGRVGAVASLARAHARARACAVAMARLVVAAARPAVVPEVAWRARAAVGATEVADAVAGASAVAEAPAAAPRARACLIREPSPNHHDDDQHQRHQQRGSGRQTILLRRRRRRRRAAALLPQPREAAPPPSLPRCHVEALWRGSSSSSSSSSLRHRRAAARHYYLARGSIIYNFL
eukprot:COSAG02_NODE_3019_length_7535_cov_9.178456_1_plen_332_part_00